MPSVLPLIARITNGALLKWIALILGLCGLFGFVDQYGTAVEALVKVPLPASSFQATLVVARGELIFQAAEGGDIPKTRWSAELRWRSDIQNVDFTPVSLTRSRTELGDDTLELRIDSALLIVPAATVVLLRWTFQRRRESLLKFIWVVVGSSHHGKQIGTAAHFGENK